MKYCKCKPLLFHRNRNSCVESRYTFRVKSFWLYFPISVFKIVILFQNSVCAQNAIRAVCSKYWKSQRNSRLPFRDAYNQCTNSMVWRKKNLQKFTNFRASWFSHHRKLHQYYLQSREKVMKNSNLVFEFAECWLKTWHFCWIGIFLYIVKILLLLMIHRRCRFSYKLIKA